MEWPSASLGSGSMIIEQAREELQMLEAHHPNRFDYLKHELKSFIFLLESQNLLLPNNNNSQVFCVDSVSAPTCSTTTTRGSSTSKKRKNGSCEMERTMGCNIESHKRKLQRCDDGGYLKRRDRVDVVIERAQACLHKIQQFKTSFS